ncbi:MAG: hypothetical protein QOG29_2046 [Gaiellaceae bacterium]|nr:hypothetical protein [Gaiellaceae bacterium]
MDAFGAFPRLHVAGELWDLPLMRAAAFLARFRFVAFALLAAYLVGMGTGWALQPHGIGGDWHYYADGGRALFGGSYEGGRGGVHLFADHPELTTGPLSLLAARGLLVFGADAWFAAHVAIAALGLLSIFLLERAAAPLRQRHELQVASLVGGLLVVRMWNELALTGHIDDALALAGLALLAWAVVSRKPYLAGFALAAAVTCKPWAIVAAPLLAALPARRLLAFVITPLAVACAAAPFVLGDGRTLGASGKYNLGIAADSGLRVLHLAAGSAPHWLRAAQLGACLAVATLAVLRGRPEAVLFLALATKVALDSQTVAYYSAAALFGALAYDLIGRRSALPVWTLVTYLALHSSMDVVASPILRADIRIGVPVAVVLLVIGSTPRTRGPSATSEAWQPGPPSGIAR